MRINLFGRILAVAGLAAPPEEADCYDIDNRTISIFDGKEWADRPMTDEEYHDHVQLTAGNDHLF